MTQKLEAGFSEPCTQNLTVMLKAQQTNTILCYFFLDPVLKRQTEQTAYSVCSFGGYHDISKGRVGEAKFMGDSDTLR